MASDIQRIGSKIINFSADEDADFALCSVRLCFRISVLAPLQSKMLVLTRIERSDKPKSKRARRKIIEASWRKLEAYFAGSSMEDERENIFADPAETNQDEEHQLALELDDDLKQELYLIDLEFSAVGK